jgi:methionyl-tRNA synthetase
MEGDEKTFKKYWPADLHIIGKDILKFHAIYWPAMLLSGKNRTSKEDFSSWIYNCCRTKMSKSLGNIVNPLEIIEKYGADPLRYFLLRESSPFEDLDFTLEKFKQRYNSDLVAGLGNLTARIISLAKKFKVLPFSKIRKKNLEIKEEILNVSKKYKEAMKEFKFNEALSFYLGLDWDFAINSLKKRKPWEERKGQREIIENLLFSLSQIAEFLEPFLPQTSEKIKKQIKGKKIEHLFPKV